MPTLKQLTCSVEWSASGPSLPLSEYGTAYFDGLVETYVALPAIPTPFSIRLKSDGYIAPGLSLFVYIDGEYQCNRGRNNLQIPTGTSPKKQTEVDFVVRQKEEPLPGGGFIGRQWRFGSIESSNGTNAYPGSSVPEAEYMGTIEVVVLRSAELQRTRAPGPSASEKHPLAFDLGLDDVGAQAFAKASLSDVGGLFDGSSDCAEHLLPTMPFGGDGAWDDGRRDDSPFGEDWSNVSGKHHQQQPSIKQNQNDPPSAGHSLPSNPAGSPAIIINVNQPAAASSSPWAAAQPQPWNAPARSVADSWASTPAPGSVLGSHARQGQGKEPDASWQTWMKDDAEPRKRSPKSGWDTQVPENAQNSGQQSSSSSSNDSKNKSGIGGARGNSNNRYHDSWGASPKRGRDSRPQSVPGAWGQADQKQQSQAKGNGHGWNNQGGNTSTWDAPKNSSPRTNTDWNNNANDHSNDQNNDGEWNNQNEDWNNDQSRDDQGNWDSGGANDQPADNSGWGNGENHGNHEQGNWNSNDNQNSGGGWNTDQNAGQGDNGWDANNNSNGNDNQDNNRWGNNDSSGNDWNNANAGAQETQASNGQGWNTAGNQDGWKQEEGGRNSGPANAGGVDPARTKSRRDSSGKVKSTTPSLSKQASMNATAQKLGWRYSSANGANQAPNPSGPPGAWPNIAQNAMTSAAYLHGATGVTKPYHVTLDVAGNPRLPDLQPAPAPPPPPPVQLATQSLHVSNGEPALYQHKVASPRYIDTHDKPYAVFVFKYRTKAILEQILNITIADSEDVEKAKLANLSKEELIAEVIKIKSRTNSQSDSASNSSLGNAPTSVNSFPNNNWGGQPSGGGPVENWLDKTPAGASASGHEPWGGDANGSVKHGSHKGGKKQSHQAWDGAGKGNGNGGDWGGSQKSKGGNKGSRGGGWGANNNGSGAKSQQNDGWDNNGGESGGHTASNEPVW